MRLINDEIGIFHKTLISDDKGTEYYNIWEDAHFASETCHAIELPFSNIPSSEEVAMGISLLWEPGDKIGIFFNERGTFFSFVKHFTVYGECMHSARISVQPGPSSFASMLLFLTRRGVEQDVFGSYTKSH